MVDFMPDPPSGGGKPPVGNIWSRGNPFKKPAAADPKAAAPAAAERPDETDDEPEEANLPKGVPVLDLYNVTISVSDPLIKVDIAVRNKGTARADDVKVKVLGPPLLRPVTSPMMTLGDIVPKSRATNLVQFDMGNKYVDEYANFSVIAECSNGKSTNAVYTCMTGRRPMTATEILEQKEKEMRARFGKGDAKKDDKKK